ncbi:MAG: PqqD family protein [Acidobacteria bacterium]|nr:PqqD family protein [Acidobacteriota bacterium]
MDLSLKPQARTENIVSIDAENETLVYDLETNKAHCLNEPAGFVLKNCDGVNTAADIRSLISKRTGEDVPEDHVWLALTQLKRAKLLKPDSAGSIQDIDRRAVIKRLTLTSAAALPFIASLAAPKSAYALISCSCTSPGQNNVPACTTPGNCLGPNCASGGHCTSAVQGTPP